VVAVGLAALLLLKGDPVLAVALAVIVTTSAAEVGCRLTWPSPSPRVRATTVVIISVVVVWLISTGVDPVLSVLVVTATAALSVRAARQAALLSPCTPNQIV
jgi:hypothetical protein